MPHSLSLETSKCPTNGHRVLATEEHSHTVHTHSRVVVPVQTNMGVQGCNLSPIAVEKLLEAVRDSALSAHAHIIHTRAPSHTRSPSVSVAGQRHSAAKAFTQTQAAPWGERARATRATGSCGLMH